MARKRTKAKVRRRKPKSKKRRATPKRTRARVSKRRLPRTKRKSKRKAKRKAKPKPFGGYGIDFTNRHETMEDIFGKKPVTPSLMTKKLWQFIKKHHLGSK